MEPRTERLLLILADISGYTKFMLASQVALMRGEQLAAFRHLPMGERGLARSILTGLLLLLLTPIQLLLFPPLASVRAVIRRRRRRH